MNEVVLDASALLALLKNEPGGEIVAEAFPHVVISTVNLSEVVAKLTERSMPTAIIRTLLDSLDLDVRAFDTEAAFAAGALRATTRELGLSFGARACLALGQQLQLTVLTTDRAWVSLDLGITVRPIR
jgi:ribonuclease VapC